MFTILKQQFKHSIARFVYNFLKTGYDVEHWTRTTSCSYCAQPIAVGGRFCTYCGRVVTLPRHGTTSTGGADPTSPPRRAAAINLEPVTIMFPKHIPRRHFLNYVRTHKGPVGPATQAHRSFQDYNQRI